MLITDEVLCKIGKDCQAFRKCIGKTQKEVATDTCYTVENVSRFERGLNNNAKILIWYILNGYMM